MPGVWALTIAHQKGLPLPVRQALPAKPPPLQVGDGGIGRGMGRDVSRCPSSDLVARASAIALEIAHPVYDCLYLACAEVEGAPLVTADGRLRDAAEAYPGVDIWHIAVPEVRKRIATAATALVIQESTLRELIAAYAAFSGTVNTVEG